MKFRHRRRPSSSRVRMAGYPLWLCLPVLALCLSATLPSAASEAPIDCEAAVSTPDLEHCAALEQAKVERKLNAAYQKLVQHLSQPDTELDDYTAMRQKLLEAQRAWIRFREADCAAQYVMHASGTIRTLVHIGCMQERAEQRIKELENYVPY
ncbi:lysozyme inhibitor LprI family protein [Azotobacter salinestris]|uniref:lysozyme inhibitor LprI family protein n=1 Tax=Azotobacter salinestris TaxID=69964 RepID=UPI0032E0124E